MKTTLLPLVLLSALGFSIQAQQPVDVPAVSAEKEANLVVLNRDANSKSMARISTHTNRLGTVVSRTNSAYTELATGMSYRKEGEWVDSVEKIEIVPDGAEATQSRHKVHWMSNINAPGGAVHLTAPDGKEFHSRVYGLSAWDSSTGKSVLLAPLQDARGQLVGDNRIVYPNAFQGVKADIEYVFTLAGLEQNIIIREQLPTPASLELNPEFTRIQVLTEFLTPPAPAKTTVQTGGVADDALLDFGEMKISVGHAFFAQAQGQPSPLRSGRVSKQWTKMENRDFLIEEIPWSAITPVLKDLPLHAQVAPPLGAPAKKTAALHPLMQRPIAAALPSAPMQIARATSSEPGLLIDYTLGTVSVTNFVFQGDVTYFISGVVSLYGTTIFEGNSVLKFTNSGSVAMDTLTGNQSPVFDTTPYRPVIFTSANDNSAGDTIAGSTGNPTRSLANYLVQVSDGTNSMNVIQHARFSYAATVFYSVHSGSHVFRDCQFVNCGTNTHLVGASDLYLENVLAAKCGTILLGDPFAVHGENMTVDSCTAFAGVDSNYGYPYSGGLTNCILTNVDDSITNFYLDHTLVATNGPAIFQVVGGGSYYLADGSTNRDAGTTNIDAALLALLSKTTTYPPIVYSNMVIIGTNLALYPQAQRDTNLVDLGYHYQPLDYVFGQVVLTNVALTAAPGTAIGTFKPGSQYGIWPIGATTIDCQGSPTAHNYLVRYNVVQEASTTNWQCTGGVFGSLIYFGGFGNVGTTRFRFTDWSVMAADYQFNWENELSMPPVVMQDCQFFSGQAATYYPSVAVTNCLFRRTYVYLEDDMTSTNSFCNCLFLQGTFEYCHFDAGPWTLRENLFDRSTNYIDCNDTALICSNNAYFGGNTVFLPSHNDVTLTTNDYQIGPLGSYYYPTNTNGTSLATLQWRGSQPAADAGLYHYTVTTNQVADGANTVSIGFHYVATDGSGNPLDYDSDGIPDYLEDLNGNGTVDSGETDWQSASDLGLFVRILRPTNNSTIP